jgi:hypothetical protein
MRGRLLGRAAHLALRSAPLFAIAALWTVSAPAQTTDSARPAGLVVGWKGPDDCQRGEAVQAKVLRLLGSSPHALEPFEANVTVRRETAKRYVAELHTHAAGGSGRKRLEGESCDAIALASAVVIALSIDPAARLDAEPEPEPEGAAGPAPEADPGAKPAPPTEPSDVESASRPPPRELIGYVHASVGVLFRMLDEPTGSLGAGFGARYRRFSLELAGSLYQSRQVTRSDRPNVGAELRLYTGELLGCYAALQSRWTALDACAGARLEYLSAAAFGVSNPDQGSVLLFAGLAALRGRFRATSWLVATLDLGVAARPFHPTFVLEGVGDVYEIPPVSALVRTGLALEF